MNAGCRRLRKVQVVLNLGGLGLLPALWVIPAALITGLVGLFIPPESMWMLLFVLITFSPWISALILV